MDAFDNLSNYIEELEQWWRQARIRVVELVDEVNELKKENKRLREYADNLDSENDNQAIEIEELKKENKKLKEELKHREGFRKNFSDGTW